MNSEATSETAVPVKIADDRFDRVVQRETSPERGDKAKQAACGAQVVGMPMFSDEVNELITALALAQVAFEGVERTQTAKIKSDRANFEYKYADLDAYMSSVRVPLAQNSIVLFQFPAYEPGFLGMFTRAVHKSGQWAQNYVRVPVDNSSKDQKVSGIAMTYARRYGMTALLALSAGMPDTDGHAPGEFDQEDEVVRVAAVRPLQRGGAVVRLEDGAEYVTDSAEVQAAAETLAESGAAARIDWESRQDNSGGKYRHLIGIAPMRRR